MAQISREAAIDRLIAKDAITTVLSKYAQAIDRCDIEQLKTVYWPEATDDHGTFSGNAMEFAEHIMPLLSTMTHTMHHITTIDVTLIEANRAQCQSYFMAWHEVDDSEVIVGGRYLDNFECRDGEWRIRDRVVVMDWNQTRPNTAKWGAGEMFSTLKFGGRAPGDISYGWRRK